MSAPEVLCLGEALIDVVATGDRTNEHVGGSLLNVAAGVANLEHPASICAWWGKDERGDRLAAWAGDAGVTVVPGTDSAEKTAVAYARLDDEGKATYAFDLTWAVPDIRISTGTATCTRGASPPPSSRGAPRSSPWRPRCATARPCPTTPTSGRPSWSRPRPCWGGWSS